MVNAPAKRGFLTRLLADPSMARVIVFTRTKHGANRVAEHLDRAGIVAEAIHGNKSQGARQRALEAFRSGEARVLVATDIAARGIDIDDISHVVNFDIPNDPESYVHRIGRTARAGASGIAISLCDGGERAYLRDIERLTQQKIPVAGAVQQDNAAPGRRGHHDQPRQDQPRQDKHRDGMPHRGRPQRGRSRHQQRRRAAA
jgi:ATP-dependent RNA helicase RhlE